MEGFVIKYTDINNLLWEYKSKLEGLISKLETCERSINQFIQSDQFIGETATAAKNYLYDVHITMISCLKVATQNMLDDIAYHKACYNEIDGSTNFRLDEEAIREFRTKLATNSADAESYAQSVQQAVSNISDISDVNTPGTNGIIELHEQLDQELLNFIETIQTQESTMVTIIENTVDLMVDSIKNCLGKIGTSKTAITTYTSNSFYADIDVYTLAYLSEYFYQQHTVNQETYDAIWDVEQQLKDAAEEREVQGVIKAIGGIVLVVVGVACIAASLGAATPAVVAAGTMIGSGTTVFGITDTAEGAQDVYYGSISDLDSTAVNQLKEVVFQGNEEAYYFTEGVFSFAASAFIPIGKASTVGKLTFRSGSTIIAKEGLSTLAGEGVSKLTTDLSGNQTVGMMAGMLASGLTSHGLDKLDVKFKQKSFTDLMKQGMVESSNFSVDDIIKGVENGEIPLSNNIQKGNYGEIKMDAYFESQGYERISLDRVTDLNAPNHQGIDGVYYNPDGHPPYVIGEAKYGSSRLSTLADGTPQMSREWIEGGKGTPRLELDVGKNVADDILLEGYESILVNVDKEGNIIIHLLDENGHISR